MSERPSMHYRLFAVLTRILALIQQRRLIELVSKIYMLWKLCLFRQLMCVQEERRYGTVA